MSQQSQASVATQVHVVLILDASGSMEITRGDAIGSVNGYIAAARRDRALYEARFTLVVFNSQGIETIRRDQVMETVALLKPAEYVCAAMTPLFDAIGHGIALLDEALAGKAGKAVVVVMTDGNENSSSRFTLDSIQQLIKSRQESGWAILFLGAGLEVAKQGVQLGAQADLVADFAGGDGLRAVGCVMAACVSRLAQSMDAGLTDSERAILRGERDD
jgi:Mg-chelatase subunit ChlD